MKFSEKSLQAIEVLARKTAKTEVNSACICLGYQPKVPENAQKLKRK